MAHTSPPTSASQAPNKELAEKFGDYRRALPQGKGRRVARQRDADLAASAARSKVEINLEAERRRDDVHLHPARSSACRQQEMKICGRDKATALQRAAARSDAHGAGPSLRPGRAALGRRRRQRAQRERRGMVQPRHPLPRDSERRPRHQLRVLFTLKEYPRDMIVVYAQGYSMCDFLINTTRAAGTAFLKFVGLGMKNNNRNWEAGGQRGLRLRERGRASGDVDRASPQAAAAGRGPDEGSRGDAGRHDAASERRAHQRRDGRAAAGGSRAAWSAPWHRAKSKTKPVEAKPAARPDDRPPPIAMLLPPEPPKR